MPSVNLLNFFAKSRRVINGLTPQILDQLTSTWIQVTLGGARVHLTSALEHEFVLGSVRECHRPRESRVVVASDSVRARH